EQIDFDSDLSGPFAILIINKETCEVTCITDLMSFIPVYKLSDSRNVALSTHVDILAKLTEQNNKFDEVSIADFILHGVTTYPYTMYKNINQISPASIHALKEPSMGFHSKSYWIP